MNSNPYIVDVSASTGFRPTTFEETVAGAKSALSPLICPSKTLKSRRSSAGFGHSSSVFRRIA
jgi:hypothetical protein